MDVGLGRRSKFSTSVIVNKVSQVAVEKCQVSYAPVVPVSVFCRSRLRLRSLIDLNMLSKKNPSQPPSISPQAFLGRLTSQNLSILNTDPL